MGKILLIYTGGTIGMKENHLTGALESVDFKSVLMAVHEIREFDVDTVSFDPPLDSSDMGPKQWRKLAEIIVENYGKYDGFVVLHGTDTMAYTASALSFMLEGLRKPVVLTGSQLPIGKLRTDGTENLVTAIEIASAVYDNGEPRVPEVSIFFHDKLLRGNRTTKSSAERFDAFHSYNYPPLARSAVDIEYNTAAIMKVDNVDKPLIPHYDMDTNMLVMSMFPGIKADVLGSMLSIKGLKGVILRTFGAGNAPQDPTIANQLRQATEKGIVIVNITQCTDGNVEMHRYGTGLHLYEAGVISGQDATVEAALTKMMRLFGDGMTADEVREAMTHSLCGEI